MLLISTNLLRIFTREIGVIKRTLRRNYYLYFKPDYVKRQIERRKGVCGKHGCCSLSILSRIYNIYYRKCLSKDGGMICLCWKNLPYECKTYPLDEKDKIPETRSYCNFYWK